MTHSVVLLLAPGTAARALLGELDVLAALLAALGHDVGHPGHNNAFEMSTLGPLALAHGDDAVLERHHAHLLWQLLLAPLAPEAAEATGAGAAQGQGQGQGAGPPLLPAHANTLLSPLSLRDLRELRRVSVNAIRRYTSRGR